MKDFLQAGGKIIEQRELDEEMVMLPGPHLRFLYYLISKNDNVINNYIDGRIKESLDFRI